MPLGGQTPPDRVRLREILFSIVGDSITGSRVLDLFAGCGILGLEALSRGARHATFVEESIRVLRVLEENIGMLDFRQPTSLLCGDPMKVPDLEAAFTSEQYPFGLVLMSPPSSMIREPLKVELIISRISAFLRSNITNDDSLVAVRFPSSYQEPLPFPDYREKHVGPSRLVLLTKSSLSVEL